MESQINKVFSFGEFKIDVKKRLLLRQGESVNLNPKAFDLLLILVENRGEILSKNELLESVWADQYVEENNLTVQISALRKSFGEKKGENRFIATVPGKGYKFVADVQPLDDESNEVVIESHSFSRILIEEGDFEETSGNGIPFESEVNQNRRLGQYEKQKTISGTTPLVPYSIAGVVLLVSFLGIYFWGKAKTSEKNQFSITKITTSGRVSNATLTPDSKYTVYSQTEETGESLWLRQIDTGSQMQILSVKPVKYVGLTVSPDGSLIYATVFGGYMSDPQIWRVPLLGGSVDEIKEVKTGAAVSLSPDGKQFAFTESRSSLKETHLGIADSNGTNKQILVRAADEKRSFPNFDSAPVAWSPDKSVIACIIREKLSDGAKKSGILLVNPVDRSERFISEKRWDYIEHLVWIDAETLAFTAFTANPWQGQIWMVSRKSGEARLVTKELSSYTKIASANGNLLTVQRTTVSHIRIADFDEKAKTLQAREIYRESGIISSVAWANDNRILYFSNDGGKPEIWRMQIDGTNPEQLTVNANASFGMSVSPIDGSLVFCSTVDGKHALQITDSEGRNMRRLTEGTEDVFPNFTPDGKSVIFQRGLNDKTLTLWRYDLADGKITRLTETQASHPAVSPDGAQIAYYFMDRETDNLWRVGLISSLNGDFFGKVNLPPKITDRRMRWHPSGRFLTQIFYTGENASLLLLPLDGGNGLEVPGLGKGDVNWFEWSQNGKNLIASQTNVSRDIVLIKDF